jgi:ParB/RepB/Spo0J family partition protein
VSELQAEGLRVLPIAEIKIPDVRVTSQWDNELLEHFKASIRAVGVVAPIIVVHDMDGYCLVDGLHRLQEAQALGEKEIKAYVFKGSIAQVHLLNLQLNHMRGKTPPTQMAKVVRELQEKHGLQVWEIAQKTGISKDYIQKLLDIARCHPLVLEALDNGDIKVGHAYEISRIPDHEIQLKVLYQQLTYRWTVQDLKDHVDNVLKLLQERAQGQPQSPQKPPRELVKIQCDVCGSEHPAKIMVSKILCPACMGVLADRWAKMAAQTASEAEPDAYSGGQNDS